MSTYPPELCKCFADIIINTFITWKVTSAGPTGWMKTSLTSQTDGNNSAFSKFVTICLESRLAYPLASRPATAAAAAAAAREAVRATRYHTNLGLKVSFLRTLHPYLACAIRAGDMDVLVANSTLSLLK